MQPDQRPQKPPREPINDHWPSTNRKTYQNTYSDRTKDPYPLPGKPTDTRPKP